MPGLHCEHAAWPLALPKPFSQGRHCELPVCAWYRPAGQAAQTLAPVAGEYVLAAHGVHAAWPVLLAKKPAGQGRHEAEPGGA